ncbi:hypothetical protein BS47DRAFT_1421694 [Hydnum rufescens UP504]|uniref:Uncharacterized protein n=1 Tax=Hydnum rufescens UP504 TaxID=1448309 RepID=A0A9P6AL84_9AGAM|nr:hypothetical protein BS47DRAFT_1421694 [Hydnum rufescens UP504]
MGPRVFPPPSLPHTRGKEVSRRSEWGMWVLLPEPDGASLVKTQQRLERPWDGSPLIAFVDNLLLFGFEIARASSYRLQYALRMGNEEEGFTGTTCLNRQFSKHPTKVGNTVSRVSKSASRDTTYLTVGASKGGGGGVTLALGSKRPEINEKALIPDSLGFTLVDSAMNMQET